jgi:hypothetical protein
MDQQLINLVNKVRTPALQLAHTSSKTCSRLSVSRTTSWVAKVDPADPQDLPQITVIGSQSSGKSSVLEVRCPSAHGPR